MITQALTLEKDYISKPRENNEHLKKFQYKLCEIKNW